MKDKLKGACLCGSVTFRVASDFRAFFQCHCKQCQQLSGSAFAANLFTRPDNIEWLSGEEHVIRYQHPTRTFANAFCRICGASVPYLVDNGKSLIVPAGSLVDDLSIVPQANLFRSEQACWLQGGLQARNFDRFPQ